MRECLKCGKPTNLPTITISLGAEIRVLHLCEKDAKPVQALFKLGKASPGEPAAAPVRTKGHSIVPVD